MQSYHMNLDINGRYRDHDQFASDEFLMFKQKGIYEVDVNKEIQELMKMSLKMKLGGAQDKPNMDMIGSFKLQKTSPTNRFVLDRLNRYFRMLKSNIFRIQ